MPKSTPIAQAIQYLKTNWRNGKTLKEIADLYRVDAGNLDRAFRHQTGMTSKHFIDQQRKQHVAARLESNTRGYALGAELGFVNDLAFYRWVKRAFGVSFSALRAKTPRRAMTRKRNKKK